MDELLYKLYLLSEELRIKYRLLLLGFFVVTESLGVSVIRECSFVVLYDFGVLGIEDGFLLFLLVNESMDLGTEDVGGGWTKEGKACCVCTLFATQMIVVRVGRRHRES
jgi:hypothetical protein